MRITRSSVVGIFVLIAAVNLALYFAVFQMEYYSDDLAIIPLARGSFSDMLTMPSNDRSPMATSYYRPLPMLTFWLIEKVGLASPGIHYGFNLVLNILAGFLAVLCIAQCFRGSWMPWQRRIAALAGLLASGGFISAYSVAWISQRFDLMAGVAAMLCLYLAVRWWQGGSAWNLAGIFAAGLSGMLSKETAFLLPLLVPAWFAMHRSLCTPTPGAAKRMFHAWAIVVLAALVGLGVRFAAGVEVPEGLIGIHVSRIPYGYIKSALETIVPFRLGTLYGVYSEGLYSQIAILALIAVAVLVPVLYLIGRAAKARGLSAVLFTLLPFVAAITLFGLRGYTYPRLLYLPHLVLWTSMGCLLAGLAVEWRKWVLTALAFVCLLQMAASMTITDYYNRVSEHVHSVLVPAATRLQGTGARVIVPVYNRLLFRQNGIEVLPPLSSWEDPFYEWLFYSQSAPVVSNEWRSPRVLALTSVLPNRFFHMAEEGFNISSLFAPGDTIHRSGYRVIIERTAMSDKVKDLRMEFDSIPDSRAPIFLDDEAQFRRLR